MSKEHKGIGKFILGLAVGAGLGVLFAPDKGEVTRKKLKNKLDELTNYISSIDKDELKKQFTKKVNEIKKELKELDKEKVLAIAKEKAAIIVRKTDELIDLAKEKAEPVVEKVGNDLKAKAINVLKDTTEKLENSKTSKTVRNKKTK